MIIVDYVLDAEFLLLLNTKDSSPELFQLFIEENNAQINTVLYLI